MLAASLNHHPHTTERTVIRLILVLLIGAIAIVGLGIFGYRGYVHWEGKRLLRRAHAFFDAGDSKSAALTARRALQLNPSNVDACRILAEIGERDGLPSAITWRQQVVQLVPGSTDDVIALAKTALQFNDIGAAERALNSISGKAEQLATYHDTTAQLAIAKQDAAAAEKHFGEAVRLAPSDKAYQLKLALLQLRSNSPEVHDRAAALLQQFMEDPSLRLQATRGLRDNATERKDATGLLDFSARLAGYPEATFLDRLSHVQVLRALNGQEFPAKLEDLQNEAAKSPGKLALLLSWMSTNGLSVLGLDWVKRLPPDVVSQKPAAVAVADCYVSTNDWAGLTQWCKKTNWSDLEFLRHAYLTRAARGRVDDLDAKSEWNLAMHDAGNDGNRLLSLEQISAKWGWKNEAENLLWALGKDPEKQHAALASLNQYYTEKGQSADLYRVVARLSEINPKDEQVQNNLAVLSLLLNLNTDTAQAIAQHLYQKHPESSVFASTYAFSLYHKGQYSQAVKVMNQLKPEALLEPSVAAYYGIFLAAAGDKAKAGEYLERGSKASLLPEEKVLLEKAQHAITAQ